MSYGVFAQYYDALTKNVNYEEITQEDRNVMGEAIRFCRRLTGVFPEES